MHTAKIRVLIVENDEEVRTVWEQILTSQVDMKLLGSYSDSLQATCSILQNKPDVCLLHDDEEMPYKYNLLVLLKEPPTTRVICLNAQPTEVLLAAIRGDK